MTRALPTPAALLAVAWVLAGCGSGGEEGAAGAPSGPTLLPVDSVLLVESDTVHIGRPGKPLVDPHDGSFYVPDIFSNVVYRFGRSGELLNTYGRPGQGPGEFRSVGAVFVPDDSTVGVVDRGNVKFSYFDRTSGELLRERKVVTAQVAQSSPLEGEFGYWLHVYAPGEAMGLARLRPDGGDSLELAGRLPGSFRESIASGRGRYARLAGMTGFLDRNDGRILHGYRVFRWIHLRDADGAVVDSVYLPGVRRRGVPGDLRRRMDEEGLNQLVAMEATSALFGLHVLPEGQVAFVHHDVEILDDSKIPPPTAATVWVSLLSEDLQRACVDARLSEVGDAKPMNAFRGDTVFQLERRVVGDGAAGGGARLETWLRMVRIDLSGCDWIPARPPEE